MIRLKEIYKKIKNIFIKKDEKNLIHFPVSETECITVEKNVDKVRDKIVNLEKMMLQSSARIEIETTHYFTDGIYAREIFIPKGTLLTGKIHKTEHLNVVSKGRIVVMTDEGMKEVSAPHTMIASPGTKRIGYALEDTVWTTFHGTNEKNLEKLEEQLIAPSFEDLQLETKKKLKEG